MTGRLQIGLKEEAAALKDDQCSVKKSPASKHLTFASRKTSHRANEEDDAAPLVRSCQRVDFEIGLKEETASQTCEEAGERQHEVPEWCHDQRRS